jgi:GT2 family glycosyltransferase
MFGATTTQLRRMLPAFDEGMFLYCEELAFAHRAERLGYRFVKVPVTVSHIGAVSTYEFNRSYRKFFEVWSQSMASYLANQKASRVRDR